MLVKIETIHEILDNCTLKDNIGKIRNILQNIENSIDKRDRVDVIDYKYVQIAFERTIKALQKANLILKEE